MKNEIQGLMAVVMSWPHPMEPAARREWGIPTAPALGVQKYPAAPHSLVGKLLEVPHI